VERAPDTAIGGVEMENDDSGIPKFVENFFHRSEPLVSPKPKAIYQSETGQLFELYEGGRTLPAHQRSVKRT